MLRMTIFGLGAFLVLGTTDIQAQIGPDLQAKQRKWRRTSGRKSGKEVRQDVRRDVRRARHQARMKRRPSP
jgi:hypothetical protein